MSGLSGNHRRLLAYLHSRHHDGVIHGTTLDQMCMTRSWVGCTGDREVTLSLVQDLVERGLVDRKGSYFFITESGIAAVITLQDVIDGVDWGEGQDRQVLTVVEHGPAGIRIVAQVTCSRLDETDTWWHAYDDDGQLVFQARKPESPKT